MESETIRIRPTLVQMTESKKMLWNSSSGTDSRTESKGREKFEEIKWYRFCRSWGQRRQDERVTVNRWNYDKLQKFIKCRKEKTTLWRDRFLVLHGKGLLYRHFSFLKVSDNETLKQLVISEALRGQVMTTIAHDIILGDTWDCISSSFYLPRVQGDV